MNGAKLPSNQAIVSLKFIEDDLGQKEYRSCHGGEGAEF